MAVLLESSGVLVLSALERAALAAALDAALAFTIYGRGPKSTPAVQERWRELWKVLG